MLMEFFYFGGNPPEDLSASFFGNSWFIILIMNLGMFLARITPSHLVKIHKDVTEQLTSNTVSAQIFLFWTLNPG